MKNLITLVLIQRAMAKPNDYPKCINAEDGIRYYSGDTIVFASNEGEYFIFGFRIKSIK